MTRARGADFSSYQSDAAVRAAIEHDLRFAMVKQTQGVDYVSPRAPAQINLLRAHLKGYGASVGSYHFITADASGLEQWDFFEARLRTTGGAALVAVDHEPDEHGVLAPDHIVRAFIRRGQQRGYRVGRYGDGERMRSSLGEDWRWVAWWSSSPPPFRWDVWQFAAGTGGSPDWDVFRGDELALQRFVSPPKSPAARVLRRKPGYLRRRPRWWLVDRFAKVSLGPYRLTPALAAAVVRYVAAHPLSAQLELVRR